jgi:hypothetical protein
MTQVSDVAPGPLVVKGTYAVEHGYKFWEIKEIA